jgi:translation initiation factor 2 alpha subunit (eIF-2alpha)
MKTKLQEDDIVLCTVKRIERTTVFLDIEDNGQGSMILSEVSPGRIRNLREFVAPNKKVVCKILRIKGNNIELSLRRVTAKERDEVLDRNRKEKALTKMLQPILKDKSVSILQKIKEKYDLADFLDEARESPVIIKKFISGKPAEELQKIFSISKKEKEKEVKEKISIKTKSGTGLSDIKQILKTDKAEIRYIGSSKFSISVKSKDYKTANALLEEVIEEIKSKAKKLNALVETKGKGKSK